MDDLVNKGFIRRFAVSSPDLSDGTAIPGLANADNATLGGSPFHNVGWLASLALPRGGTKSGQTVSISLEFRDTETFFEVYLCSDGPALLLATIRKDIVLRNQRHADIFRELMEDITAEGVREVYGAAPKFRIK